MGFFIVISLGFLNACLDMHANAKKEISLLSRSLQNRADSDFGLLTLCSKRYCPPT
jgi:hypothetical protein